MFPRNFPGGIFPDLKRGLLELNKLLKTNCKRFKSVSQI